MTLNTWAVQIMFYFINHVHGFYWLVKGKRCDVSEHCDVNGDTTGCYVRPKTGCGTMASRLTPTQTEDIKSKETNGVTKATLI